MPFEQPEPSAVIRVRVEAARERQRLRYAGHPWRLNVHAPGPMLRDHWPLTEGAALRLDAEVYAGRLTRRGAVRVHRVAWSVADLAGVDRPGVDELDVALRLRSATPLLLSTVARRACGLERAGVSGVSEAERLARVLLSRVGEPGDPRLTDLVHELSAATVLDSLRRQAADRELGADLAERVTTTDPVQELERAGKLGIRFVVPGDEEWPDALDDLTLAPHLHERGGVPVGLWCRGPLRLDEATERAAAVVGSRSATTYGADVAGDIAATLARESWTVVSGGRLRDRPGRPPRCPGQPGTDRGRARLRRRPGLPLGAPQPDRLHRRRRPGRLRGAARVCADPDPLPGPQPTDRGAEPRCRGGRGRRAQRGVEHRELGVRARARP